jgi:hypothetical protein
MCPFDIDFVGFTYSANGVNCMVSELSLSLIIIESLLSVDVVAVDGAFSLVYGTSASAPVVGSIFALINDARLAHGKKPIGFVNPTLVMSQFPTRRVL